MTATASLPAAGHVVAGKYVLQDVIGRGGMGAVFAAENTSTGRKVAIKVMLADPSNREAIGRFEREAKAAGALESDHIVEVIDVAEEKGYAYMVLELLRGDDLGKLLEKDGRMAMQVAVQYVMQALKGIGHAHDRGIVHRDLKPSNLFKATRPDGSWIIKVLDFGISKAKPNTLDERPEALTSTKAMLGSPLYMSPEQLRSSKTVDNRADIWAIGVILYELLTGTLPFSGETLGELFAEILDARPTPPSTRAPHLPQALDAVIMRCLRSNREERYATCADLARDLAPFGAFSGQTAHISANATAFMPNAPPAVSRATGPGMQMAMTPQPYAQQHPPMPPGAAVTGSGVHPPVVKATQPLGSTPQPPWGNTTGSGVPKSNVGIIIGIGVVAVVLLGAGVGGAVWWKHRADALAAAASSTMPSATETPPPPSATVPPSATTIASAPSATTPDPSATPSVAAATSKPIGHGRPPPPIAKVDPPPKQPDPPPVEKPHPPPGPVTKPTPTGTADTR
jgi:serine/threonine-protein kinase